MLGANHTSPHRTQIALPSGKVSGDMEYFNVLYDVMNQKTSKTNQPNPHATCHNTYASFTDEVDSPGIGSACPIGIQQHRICPNSTSNGCTTLKCVHAVYGARVCVCVFAPNGCDGRQSGDDCKL